MPSLEHKQVRGELAQQTSFDAHQRSQELAAQASLLMASNETVKARQLYERASALEAEALEAVPFEKKRTRGILAVSLVSLLYKARLYAQAEETLEDLLESGIPDAARHQLNELHDEIKSRRNDAEGGTSSPSHQQSRARAVTEIEALARDIREGLLSAFVSSGTTLTGMVNFKGMLRVDGHLSGQINSEGGTLIVGINGQVDADIEVAIATIHGAINGNITASQRLEMGRTAKVNGNITTPSLVIEQGAVFEGNCQMFQQKAAQEKSKHTTESKLNPRVESAR